MSKVSSVDYPSYSGSNVSLNGNNVATTSFSNGVVNTNYNMSDAQKALYDYAQSALTSLVPQVNTFSPDTINSLQSQIDAYTSQGQNTIDSVYTPMIKSLENDIASRFGNFDNSIFMNNLNSIENKRANAVSAFAQDVMAKKSDLINNELANRYSYINLLNTLQNQPMQTALNYISTALGGSSSANSYNNNLYSTLYKQAATSGSSNANVASALSNMLSSGGGFSLL